MGEITIQEVVVMLIAFTRDLVIEIALDLLASLDEDVLLIAHPLQSAVDQRSFFEVLFHHVAILLVRGCQLNAIPLSSHFPLACTGCSRSRRSHGDRS